MARLSTPKETKKIVGQHKEILKFFDEVSDKIVETRQQIKNAVDSAVVSEVMDVLRGISIDELNRDKRGIKVKALRDYGYENIADIVSANQYQLASVYGISEDTAYTIKRIADNYVQQTHKNTKLRLSVDHQTPVNTRLIVLLSTMRRLLPLSSEVKRIQSEYKTTITDAINTLQNGKTGIQWLFTSRAKKNRIEDTYKHLARLLNGEYGSSVKNIKSSFERALNISSYEAWEDFQRNSISLINILEDIDPGVLGTNDAVYGLPEDLAREVQDEAFFPDGLLCELRRYQEWGVKYILHQERVLLGDEMGLGKTVQAIATMVSLKNTGATHFVVVCPASVITNWCREISSKSKLPVTKVHGAGRSAALKSWIKNGGVAVTTYETTGYFKLEDQFRFSLLIVDEAHYIKNAEARRSINVKSIAYHADRLLFMTGTALENKVAEMVTLIQVLQPNIANQVRGMEFLASAPQFRQIVAPVYYRRKREDVLTELPEKTESKEWCSLFPEEQAVYEHAVLEKRYADARRVSWNIEDLHKSCKARRLLEIIEESESENRKIIVFSFFLDTIRKVTELLGNRCLNPINGSITPARRQEIIDEFDNAPAGTVLAAQIQSGGTGLNIQSASVVILCEPQLKPSIENQAISRAYRMGQTRNVLVYRLLCENTVDEKITDMLEEKQSLFDAFADKSVAARESIELDNKTMGDIIQSEIDRINAKKGTTANK